MRLPRVTIANYSFDFLCFYVSILGEGYKIGIHHHMDQPIMALSDIDLSPGFVTQLSVTPTLHETTDQGIRTHVDHSTLFIITNKAFRKIIIN